MIATPPRPADGRKVTTRAKPKWQVVAENRKWRFWMGLGLIIGGFIALGVSMWVLRQQAPAPTANSSQHPTPGTSTPAMEKGHP
jgi:hypothetical protein